MVGTTKERETSKVVEEELRRAKAEGRPPGGPGRPLSNAALGIVEMAAGVAAIIFSFIAGIVLSTFLGAVVLLSGILEVINGAIQRSTGHIVIGVLGAVAGLYILANPLVSLALLGAVVGVYLVVSGAVSAYRARQSGANMTGGLIEVILGLLVLFSGFNIGLLAGIYLIVRGIITYNARPMPTKAGT